MLNRRTLFGLPLAALPFAPAEAVPDRPVESISPRAAAAYSARCVEMIENMLSQTEQTSNPDDIKTAWALISFSAIMLENTARQLRRRAHHEGREA